WQDIRTLGSYKERARVCTGILLEPGHRFSRTLSRRHFLSRASLRLVRDADDLAGCIVLCVAKYKSGATAHPPVLLVLRAADATSDPVSAGQGCGLSIRPVGRMGHLRRHAVFELAAIRCQSCGGRT